MAVEGIFYILIIVLKDRRLLTRINDNLDDFRFPIFNFPFLSSRQLEVLQTWICLIGKKQEFQGLIKDIQHIILEKLSL